MLYKEIFFASRGHDMRINCILAIGGDGSEVQKKPLWLGNLKPAVLKSAKTTCVTYFALAMTIVRRA